MCTALEKYTQFLLLYTFLVTVFQKSLALECIIDSRDVSNKNISDKECLSVLILLPFINITTNFTLNLIKVSFLFSNTPGTEGGPGGRDRSRKKNLN